VPIAHFHLTACSDEQRRRLLTEGSRCYAEVLDSPIERVRIFVHHLAPEDVAVGGQVLADGDTPAVYFTALMLRGRPVAKRHRLIAEFTASPSISSASTVRRCGGWSPRSIPTGGASPGFRCPSPAGTSSLPAPRTPQPRPEQPPVDNPGESRLR